MTCADCHKNTDDVVLAPMLHDAVWLQLACKHETLCFDCMLARADRHGVELTVHALTPAPFNRCWPSRFWKLAPVENSRRAPRGRAKAMSRCPRCKGELHAMARTNQVIGEDDS